MTPVASKLLAPVVPRRLASFREPQCHEEQPGFPPGRSRADRISPLRLRPGHCLVHQRQTVVVVLDISAAFDFVNRSALCNRMLGNKVLEKYASTVNGRYGFMGNFPGPSLSPAMFGKDILPRRNGRSAPQGFR